MRSKIVDITKGDHMGKVINFELDEQTEQRMKAIAVKNGIPTKSGTIRHLINQEWFKMQTPRPQPQTIEEEIERR